MGEQQVSANNRIELNERDNSTLHIEIGFNDLDKQLIATQRQELTQFWEALRSTLHCKTQELHFQKGFTNHARTLHNLNHHPDGEPDALPQGTPISWTNPLGSENHESSTLPIGPILTEQLEFHTIKHLFAVGPACFPRPGAANPSLTTLALARRLGHHLHQRFGATS